jgi:hypothetical protein
MTESKLTIPLPKSQKSPKLSVICGLMSTRLQRTVFKPNTIRTKRLLLKKRPTTRRSMARLSAKKRRKE